MFDKTSSLGIDGTHFSNFKYYPNPVENVLHIESNSVLSKVEIAEKVWDVSFDTGTNVIEVYINLLRKKVDKDFPQKLIHNVYGMGYVLKSE